MHPRITTKSRETLEGRVTGLVVRGEARRVLDILPLMALRSTRTFRDLICKVGCWSQWNRAAAVSPP